MNITGILPLIGTLALAAGAGTLGYLAFAPQLAPAADVPTAIADPALQTSTAQTRSLVLPAARPDIYYAAITERPLFAPGRRPQDTAPQASPVVVAQPTAAAPTTVVSRPSDLVLSGILGGDANRSAYLGIADGSGEWMRVNDDIDGWTITEIGPDWITLTAGDDTFRLELFE